jgi:Icc protein
LKLIAIVTDLHLGDDFPRANNVDAAQRWNIIFEDIKKRNVNQIVINGDIGDRPSNFVFFNELKYNGIPFTLTLGNHDFYDEAIKYFYRNNANNDLELYYAEEDEENIFIYLDSLTASISESQLNWLTRQLHSPKNITIFIHHRSLPRPGLSAAAVSPGARAWVPCCCWPGVPARCRRCSGCACPTNCRMRPPRRARRLASAGS